MSGGKEESSQESTQGVWDVQSPYLENNYAGGQNAALPQAQQAVGQMNPQLMQSWQNMMNPGVNPQLQAYQGDVQRNLQDNLLPAIQSESMMNNQLGGSRGNIGEGLAVAQANQQVTDMASNLYNEDMNRMIMAMSGARDIAGFGFTPYQEQANIVGRPTVLGESQGDSKGFEVGLM